MPRYNCSIRILQLAILFSANFPNVTLNAPIPATSDAQYPVVSDVQVLELGKPIEREIAGGQSHLKPPLGE